MFSTRSASVKPRSLVQAVADVVAIEQVGVPAGRMQPLLHQVRDRRLARAGQSGEPQHAGLLALELGPRALVHVERLPVDVVGPAQRELQQACADGVVREPVDQDETAGLAVVAVRVERDGPVEADVADADLVELELLRSQVLERIDVDLVARRRDARRHGARADLQQVRAAGKHRLLVHPDDRRLELVRDGGGARRNPPARRRG
jgi:hypothetical protein